MNPAKKATTHALTHVPASSAGSKVSAASKLAEEELMCKYKELEVLSASLKRDMLDLENEKNQIEYALRLSRNELCDLESEHEKLKLEILSSNLKIQSLRLQNSYLTEEVGHYKMLLEKSEPGTDESSEDEEVHPNEAADDFDEKISSKTGWWQS